MPDAEFQTFLKQIRAGYYKNKPQPYKNKLARCDPQQKQQAEEAFRSPPPLDIKNTEFEWLTYESLFNKAKFRKPNQAFQFGVYLIPSSDVNIFVRDYLDEETSKNLYQAFFPADLDRNKITQCIKLACQWKRQATDNIGFILQALRVSKTTAGNYYCLPYNYWDNTVTSQALGTNDNNYKLLKLKDTWQAWKTASRTSIVRTKTINRNDQVTPYRWDFGSGEVFRQKTFKFENDPSHFEWKNCQPTDFSVKTGVIFVGQEDQSKASKDVLDGWRIGALRSDYVAAVDEQMKEKAAKENRQLPNDLVILTEILGITEKQRRGDNKDYDGMLVRDLSPLERNRIYIPPTALPFIDPSNFTELKNEFECVATEAWREMGKVAWATALGRAKALFLLRYGLQHINPNPQNYLIEWTREPWTMPSPNVTCPLKPTGRIVIRDLNDAAYVREVVWALYGPTGQGLPVGNDVPAKQNLAKLSMNVFKYEFNFLLAGCQETGSTDEQFGPPGVQFLWQRFSAYINGDKIAAQHGDYENLDWKLLLKTMAEWGDAHNRAYVACIDEQLDANLTAAIKWGDISLQDLQTYLNNYRDLLANFPRRTREIEWEEEAAKVIQNFLKSDDGKNKIRAYRDNCWQSLR